MVYIPADDGRWIDENYARLAEIVQDYDPTLELRWIPTDKRTRDDGKPYVIVDTRNNIPVLYASELDTPVDILTKLFDADNKHGDVLKRIEANNRAVEIFRAKERLEQMEEATEQAEFLFKSPLNTLKFNGKKFDDQRRVIGTSGGRKIL